MNADNRNETHPTEQQQPKAGLPAPNFRLPWRPNGTLELQQLRGRPVILAFYTGDWDPVSSDQLTQYQEALAEFERFRATLLGISVDGVWSHMAFAKKLGLSFPLLADFEPKGAVAKAYGVFREEAGTSERALFVIDAQGQIRWSTTAPVCVNPGIDGILTELEKMERSR